MDDLLDTVAAGKYLGDTPPATMEWWRATGRGPKYLKIGRSVRYRRSHLDEYLTAAERSPEAAAAQ